MFIMNVSIPLISSCAETVTSDKTRLYHVIWCSDQAHVESLRNSAQSVDHTSQKVNTGT